MSLSDTNTQLLRPDEVDSEHAWHLSPGRLELVQSALVRELTGRRRVQGHRMADPGQIDMSTEATRRLEPIPATAVREVSSENTVVVDPVRQVAALENMRLPQRASGAALVAETTRKLPWLAQRLGQALHALRRTGDR